eukprot:UN29894
MSLAYISKYDASIYGAPYATMDGHPAKIKIKEDNRELIILKAIVGHVETENMWWNIEETQDDGSVLTLKTAYLNLETQEGDKATDILSEYDISDIGLKTDSVAYLVLYTDVDDPVSIFAELTQMGELGKHKIWLSCLLLGIVYIIIGLEIVHRTLVA